MRVLVLVLTAVFVVVGAAAATRVPFDAVPDVTNVQVQVITAAPAAKSTARRHGATPSQAIT